MPASPEYMTDLLGMAVPRPPGLFPLIAWCGFGVGQASGDFHCSEPRDESVVSRRRIRGEIPALEWDAERPGLTMVLLVASLSSLAEQARLLGLKKQRFRFCTP